MGNRDDNHETIEVWCWPRLIGRNERDIRDRGHVELKIGDHFYTFLPDNPKFIEGTQKEEYKLRLINPDRRRRDAEAFFGGYAGLIRVAEVTNILSSYRDVYDEELPYFLEEGIDLQVVIIVGQFVIGNEKVKELINFFESKMTERHSMNDILYYSNIEYFYKSKQESRNCATFCFEALQSSGVIGEGEALGGDGHLPDDFIEFLRKKSDEGLVTLRAGKYRPAAFIFEKEV